MRPHSNTDDTDVRSRVFIFETSAICNNSMSTDASMSSVYPAPMEAPMEAPHVELVNADGRACVKLPGMRLKYGVIKGSSTHRRLVSQGRVPLEGSGWVKPVGDHGRWRYTPRTENRTMVRRLTSIISGLRANADSNATATANVLPFVSEWLEKNFDRYEKKDAIVRIQKFRTAIPSLEGHGVGNIRFGKLGEDPSSLNAIHPCIIPSQFAGVLNEVRRFERDDPSFRTIVDAIPLIPQDVDYVEVTPLETTPAVASVVEDFNSVLRDGGQRKRASKKSKKM
jgi:hypothetical protein